MSTRQSESMASTTWTLASRPSGTLAVFIEHVLRSKARSVLVWGVALGLFGALIVAVYPSMGDPAEIQEYAENLPENLMTLMGVEDVSSFTTIEGFLNAEIFGLLAPLALAFFPILMAAGAIAGAEEQGTMDVLMGNPLPRWQLVIGYFVAIAVSLLIVLAIFGALLWLPAQLVGVDLSVGTAATAVVGLWPLALLFGGLSLLLSAIFHRRSAAVAISAAVLVGMYFLDVLGQIVDFLEPFQPLSAFYHYGSPILDGINWASFAGVTAVAILLAALAALAFQRRDIYA